MCAFRVGTCVGWWACLCMSASLRSRDVTKVVRVLNQDLGVFAEELLGEVLNVETARGVKLGDVKAFSRLYHGRCGVLGAWRGCSMCACVTCRWDVRDGGRADGPVCLSLRASLH